MDFNMFYAAEDEKPLDHLCTDGGFAGIFRTITCVGDSLSSGEFEGTGPNGKKTYHDFFEYSWGQYLARMIGSKVYNFSRGGMTAKEYCDGWAEKKDFWNKEYASQAYIIALGVNDIYNQGMELGTIEDINRNDYRNNKPTFAGYYGHIIQRLKEISPDAKFFFMTIPREDRRTEELNIKGDAHAKLMHEMAEFFDNSYVLDFRAYAPVYDAKFHENFFLGGHMQPCGYILTARMVASYMDYLIRHNMKDFKQVGFIGTPYRNTVEV
ncbi:MAG: SGNH/GDSL hydrolase family protein [Lachnospiraceae bacterium]|nr:SGNH/GDSL hydrolase family protein [Lachnospiraceae bacterium]